jgi:ABC-type dipeptide/oligopeptide/nickel transport system permease subunit
MPEQPHSPAESILVDEETAGLEPDSSIIQIGAVEGGPEVQRERRKKGLGFAAWLPILWLALLIGSAVLAPILPIPDPVADSAPAAEYKSGPSLEHPFGVDTTGLDVFSRVVWGTRNSLFIGTVSVVIGFLVGGALGLIGGYFKGKIGGVVGVPMDIALAFPPLVLALAVVTFLGRSVSNVTIALAIVSAPILYRIARASTLSWSEREFVLACRAQGGKHFRIMTREILPNVLPAMFSIALLGIAVVIVAEGGLAIIGAGVNPEVVTWGNIIVAGQGELRDAPHIALAASLVIFFTVLSLNYLGDVVRAKFDVRESAL